MARGNVMSRLSFEGSLPATNLTCLCSMASVYGFVRRSVASLFPFEAVSEVPPFHAKRPEEKRAPFSHLNDARVYFVYPVVLALLVGVDNLVLGTRFGARVSVVVAALVKHQDRLAARHRLAVLGKLR